MHRGGEFHSQEAYPVVDPVVSSVGLDLSGRLARNAGRGGGTTVRVIVSADYSGEIKVFVGFLGGSHHVG